MWRLGAPVLNLEVSIWLYLCGKKVSLLACRGQGGFLSQAGYFGEEKFSYLCREWNYDFPVSLITVLRELSSLPMYKNK